MNRETHFPLLEGPFGGPKTVAWQLVPTGFHPSDVLSGGKVILLQALGCMCVHVSVDRATIIVWNYRVVHDCMYVCVHTWVCICAWACVYKYECILVHMHTSTHVYVCVQGSRVASGSQIGLPILCMSLVHPGLKLQAAYLYMDKLVQEFICFWKVCF